MSSYGSRNSAEYGEDEYDSNAEYEFDGNSSPNSISPRNNRGSPLNSKPRNGTAGPKMIVKGSESDSDSDVEILPFEEGVKKLFVQKKEKINEKFIPGLLVRRATLTTPNIIKLSLKDKKVIKEALIKYVKKTFKDPFIIDNISRILAGKITTKDQKILDKIEDILELHLQVSKEISIDRSVEKLKLLEKK